MTEITSLLGDASTLWTAVAALAVVVIGFTPFGQEMQLLKDFRHFGEAELLGKDTRGAECARLTEIQVATLRGVHKDRDGGGARVVLDGLHGLEAVHFRHQVIHEDHVRTFAFEPSQCVGRRFGRID